MRIGVVFPQTELGGDVGAVRAYAEAVDGLGYAHVLAYDHVLGADPSVHENWRGPYDVSTTFHEPFVLFGFLAGIVPSLELVTGVIILPQRQTALVAKQAAEVDLLTGGRFRLGVGVGWNHVEYEALGQRFDQRGRREEEQVELLRRLWTEPSLTFRGEFDTITGAGLAPMPIQRPIPVWLGGRSDPTYRRIGRLADGWFPQVRPGEDLDHAALGHPRLARRPPVETRQPSAWKDARVGATTTPTSSSARSTDGGPSGPLTSASTRCTRARRPSTITSPQLTRAAELVGVSSR